MLHTAFQQLRSAGKWAWNRLNNYEHEVDFIQRILHEHNAKICKELGSEQQRNSFTQSGQGLQL